MSSLWEGVSRLAFSTQAAHQQQALRSWRVCHGSSCGTWGCPYAPQHLCEPCSRCAWQDFPYDRPHPHHAQLFNARHEATRRQCSLGGTFHDYRRWRGLGARVHGDWEWIEGAVGSDAVPLQACSPCACVSVGLASATSDGDVGGSDVCWSRE